MHAHTSYLVLRIQGAVRDVRGEVGVVDGTEREAIHPAAAEVSNVNILHQEDTLFQSGACRKNSSRNISCLGVWQPGQRRRQFRGLTL